MRISRKLAAVAAFFVIAAVVAGCGSSVPGNSVASVAGNPITLQAFNHWMYVAAKDEAAAAAQQGESEPVIIANDPPNFTSCIKQVRAQIPSLASTSAKTLKNDCKQVFTQYTSEVMSFLVEGYWYQAQAYKQGIRYTSAQLSKDYNKAKKAEFTTAASFQAYLKDSGETVNDVKFQIQVNTLFDKLLKKYEKPVNAAAVKQYYGGHKSSFGTAESLDLNLVRTTSQAKAQSALDALNSGQSWDSVAKTYAEDASAKKNGGALTGVTANEEEAAVNKAIFAAKADQLVGPIHGIFGWYVAEVSKITPATSESLAKATPTIKSELTSQEQTSATTKVNNLVKKNWLSKTDCRSLYSVSDCKGYKAPATSTATTATPTAAATTPTTATTTTATTTTATTTTTSTAATSTTP